MRLRRKNDTPDVDPDVFVDDELVEITEPEPAQALAGPVDVADLDRDATYIDLGSLLIEPHVALDLRLQVDEETGSILSVLLVAEEGILELRAFASARGGDLWSDVRREIAADSAQRGGTATEQEGVFGTELFCEVPVSGPNGEPFVQPSRVIGCTGPRWFVRATIAGRPATDAEYAVPFEDALRALVVRRGTEAMAPGEPLPLRMPPEARQQTPEEAAADLAAADAVADAD